MPAGFNNGQIEYIKAIANVNGHKTYKAVSYNRTATLSATSHLNFQTSDLTSRYGVWYLGKKVNLRDAAGNIGIPTSSYHQLDSFFIGKSSDSDGFVGVNEREGDEGFLESTHLNIRVVAAPSATGDFHQDHTEYRMIVFRARDRQHHLMTHAKDTNNFQYNLFRGNQNYNIGFLGYENKEELEGNLNYVNSAAAGQEGITWISTQDAMTAPINKESYVVMRDHRFFLGKEYGGKNIYEDSLHWDWKDPIATATSDITETDNEKNYAWMILLIANNNSFVSGDHPSISVRITGTTHMTSG